MKTKFLFIAILFLTCSQKGEENKKFENYLENFKKIDLPFKIDRSNLFSFDRMIFDKESNRHKLNTFVEVDTQYYNYLNLSNKEEIKYRFCYKIDETNNYKAVILIRDIVKEDDQSQVWIDLYTYNNAGGIIASLTLAGYEVDVNEQFVIIKNDFEIQIESYKFLPNPKDDYEHIFATKTINLYKIDNNGKIVLIQSNVKDGKFKIVNEGYIPD
jgi:hypothetical protein